MSNILRFGNLDVSFNQDNIVKINETEDINSVENPPVVKKLYIYHLHRPEPLIEYGKDICYGMIVCSESEEKARRIHPSNYLFDEEKQCWIKNWNEDTPNVLKKVYEKQDEIWIKPSQINDIKVYLIGEAINKVEGEVIMCDIGFYN